MSRKILNDLIQSISVTPRGWRLLLYFLSVTLALVLAFSNWVYDDPYITYRYAENLAHGLGFVYNPGERILSTTTPLFTLLLAGLSYIWSDLPSLANLIGASSLALGGILIWDLGRSWKSPLVGWAGLLLYPTFPLVISTIGSETPLYLTLCLGAFTFYARQQYSCAGLLAALGTLARPDGALVPIILAIDYILCLRQPIPWNGVGLFLGITLPWILFAWAYFGSPVPVTLASKQHQGLIATSQLFAPGFLNIIKWYTAWPYALAAALALWGAIHTILRRRPWVILLAWTVLYFAAYSFLGVSRYFWYYTPLVPGFIVAIGLGLAALPQARNGIRLFQRIPQACTLLITGLLLLFLGTQTLSLWSARQNPDKRYPIYRAVGKWLKAHTPSTASVGTMEVGIIGFYARRPMVDFAGLIQPDIASQMNTDTTHEDAAQWALERYQPEYLILHQGVFPNLELGYVAEHCQHVVSFPGEAYRYPQDMVLYACWSAGDDHPHYLD